MSVAVAHKPGSTFDYHLSAEDDPLALDGWTITASARLNRSPYQIITWFSVSHEAGGVRLTATAEQTRQWPPGEELIMDLLFETPTGVAAHTSTVIIHVVRNVTDA